MRPFTRNLAVALVSLTSMQIPFSRTTIAISGPSGPLQSNDSAAKKPFNTGLVLRTDTEGVDFAPYLRPVFLSIKHKITDNLPESAKQGETGNITVQFRIDKNGKVIDDSVKVVFTTGKKDMDEACITAIRNSGPFEHLPEAFRGPYIELRQTFNFNSPKNSG